MAVKSRLENEIRYLKHVGPQRAELLNRLGLYTIKDLLYYFPRRYEDRRHLPTLSRVVPGETVTLHLQILAVEESVARSKLKVLRAWVQDTTGQGTAVWFNQGFLRKSLREGAHIFITGKVQARRGLPEIVVSDYELDDQEAGLAVGRIVPFYGLTRGLGQRYLRALVFQTLEEYATDLVEILPSDILERYSFPPLPDALHQMHFPDDFPALAQARERFAFTEFFLLQLGLGRYRQEFRRQRPGVVHQDDGILEQKFWTSLPFRPTAAQERVWQEIERDMEAPVPMARLVQGDVGSGKTLLAAAALVKTVASGYQGALMAPTEILAAQHGEQLTRFLAPLGITVALLTGSTSPAERERILQAAAIGDVQVIVGTHALIQEGVQFKQLGLAVTDEQHRFGVEQRAKLAAKGYLPDVLVMTATPIPRTLALTLYGDLDLSVVDELPPGRQPVITRYVFERQRRQMYRFLEQEALGGGQIYVVCPLIEESEILAAQAVVKEAEELQRVLPHLKIGMLHGRMRPREKKEQMESFQQGDLHVLVATPVIEVGVDVPRATVMVIEGADRFGLSQLHQLRGRVGRGHRQSYCFLLGRAASPEAQARLQAMVSINDGFLLAEEDLKIRGPGEFFGTRQHGLPQFHVADLIRDRKILELAKQEAWERLQKDPLLSLPDHTALAARVTALYSQLQL